MSLKNKWMRKTASIMPIAVIGVMLMTACGGTTATSTAVPATSVPTAMEATAMPTAMMTAGIMETPGAMMTPGVMETPGMMGTPGMMETPGAMMTPGGRVMAPINVTMNAQNGSSQNGAAVITANEDGTLMVSLILRSGTTEPQPAHIHKGTCANLDPVPAIPLTNVVDGKSETTITASMTDMATGSYAINVHKSAAEVSVYVSCGDITSSMMGSETPGMMGTPGAMMAPVTVQLNELNSSGQSGTAILGTSATGDTVMITLTNGTTEAQPAHIHKGTCANLDPNPLVPLTNVVDGKSETTITGGVTTMESGQAYAINVHKSAAEVGTYVACGDIPSSMTGSTTPGTMMETPGAMMQTPGAMDSTPVPTP